MLEYLSEIKPEQIVRLYSDSSSVFSSITNKPTPKIEIANNLIRYLEYRTKRKFITFLEFIWHYFASLLLSVLYIIIPSISVYLVTIDLLHMIESTIQFGPLITIAIVYLISGFFLHRFGLRLVLYIYKFTKFVFAHSSTDDLYEFLIKHGKQTVGFVLTVYEDANFRVIQYKYAPRGFKETYYTQSQAELCTGKYVHVIYFDSVSILL
ncbi:MAG: hypothetical protein KC708_23390 [Anaerolineae bacterium]|nr:hypothetical protein [Anaerolineae bacterium]